MPPSERYRCPKQRSISSSQGGLYLSAGSGMCDSVVEGDRESGVHFFF